MYETVLQTCMSFIQTLVVSLSVFEVNEYRVSVGSSGEQRGLKRPELSSSSRSVHRLCVSTNNPRLIHCTDTSTGTPSNAQVSMSTDL